MFFGFKLYKKTWYNIKITINMIELEIKTITIVYTDIDNIDMYDVEDNSLVSIVDIPYGNDVKTPIGKKMIGELSEGDIFLIDGKKQVLLNVI